MHHPTDRITHTTAFVTPVVEHWLERESMERESEKERKRDRDRQTSRETDRLSDTDNYENILRQVLDKWRCPFKASRSLRTTKMHCNNSPSTETRADNSAAATSDNRNTQ